MKKVILGSLFALIATIGVVSCNKEEVNNTNETVKTELKTNEYKLSLNEFKSTLESDEEINFFKNTKIVDNTIYCKERLEKIKIQKAELSNLGIKWRWAGWKSGCTIPLGICGIIPIGLNDNLEESTAKYQVNDDKIIVIPTTEDNGITTDGYLPILNDIYVNEDITVKSGIYKANVDPKTNEVNAIAIDIR